MKIRKGLEPYMTNQIDVYSEITNMNLTLKKGFKFSDIFLL